MAWIAASLMLAGVSKSGSPAPRPMTLRPGRFQRACFIRDRDGRGRLHTVERSGQKRHHHLLANVVILKRSRLFLMGSAHPKARRAASQEAWPRYGSNFSECRANRCARTIQRNIRKILRRNRLISGRGLRDAISGNLTASVTRRPDRSRADRARRQAVWLRIRIRAASDALQGRARCIAIGLKLVGSAAIAACVIVQRDGMTFCARAVR